MSTVCFYNGLIYCTDSASFLRGAVLCRDGVIVDREFSDNAAFSAGEMIDLNGGYLTPGFTDAHTHGRAGYDFNTASREQIDIMLDSYKKRGVTSLFPTLASATLESLCEQGRLINDAKKSRSSVAHAVGVHLEGRYLNPKKKGAHNIELLALPNEDDVPLLLSELSLPLHVSAAYELDDGERFIKALTEAKATVGLAHTCSDYETAMHLYGAYNISLTHMFNAMPPLHHREGGAVCAGLTTDMYTELICDGIHVSPEMVKLAYKCKGNDKLVLITDSMEATDCPDGEYSIAGLPVIVKDSIARTLDGALAGSTLNLETAVNNLAAFADISIAHALKCATANPCRMLNIYDEYGSIDIGKSADFIVASIDYNRFKIKNVYVSCGRE